MENTWGKNKSKWNEDRWEWQRLTRTANYELEKTRLLRKLWGSSFKEIHVLDLSYIRFLINCNNIKEILTVWWNDAYLSIASLHGGAHFAKLLCESRSTKQLSEGPELHYVSQILFWLVMQHFSFHLTFFSCPLLFSVFLFYYLTTDFFFFETFVSSVIHTVVQSEVRPVVQSMDGSVVRSVVRSVIRSRFCQHGNTENMYSISSENTVTKKGEKKKKRKFVNFDYQNVNSLSLWHHYVNSLCRFCASINRVLV